VINRPSKRFYEFDSFRIDIAERRLLRFDEPVPLTPKVFDVLLVLVENSGHTIGKDELMNRVWAETFVEEGNLYRSISTLRRALGDRDDDLGFIKTVPKRGYRFDGDVREILEEDEELVAEKVTKYRLAVRRDTETHGNRDGGRKLTSSGLLLVAAPVFAVLVLGAILAFNRASADTPDPHSAVKANRGTTNDKAFELYRSGRDLWQNRSALGLHQATSNLEQAVQIDPNFALAHAALADAYAFDVNLWRKAEAAANEAIRLDAGLGQPYATIGFVRTFWEWKLTEAESYFKQAISLSPDYATGHQWYSINLVLRRRGGASLAEMGRALELEPASLAINADLCQVLYFSHKFDEALDQCRRTLEMDPDFINAHAYLYDIYTAREMYAEAVAEYFKTEELSMTTPAYPGDLDDLRSTYAAGGIRAFWRRRARMLEGRNGADGYRIAKYKTRLGQHDEAINWLERAHQEREFDFVYFVADPSFRALHDNSRFRDLAASLLNEEQKELSEVKLK